MSEPERLLYRSNLLGSDLRITNFGGGNTSAKVTQKDPLTGKDVTVLWVKGSGGDLGSMKMDGFSTLYLDKLESLKGLYRGLEHEDEMVGYLPALHLRPQPPRGLDRHAAARLHPEGARRPHAPGRGDRDRRLARPRAADEGGLRRRDRLAAVAAAGLRPRPEARGDGEGPTRPSRASSSPATASSPGATRRRSATSRRCGSSRRPPTTWRRRGRPSPSGSRWRSRSTRPARPRSWPSSCPGCGGSSRRASTR